MNVINANTKVNTENHPQKSISNYESNVKKRTRKEKWKTQKLQKEYKKRSQSVKAPFKVLKQKKI